MQTSRIASFAPFTSPGPNLRLFTSCIDFVSNRFTFGVNAPQVFSFKILFHLLYCIYLGFFPEIPPRTTRGSAYHSLRTSALYFILTKTKVISMDKEMVREYPTAKAYKLVWKKLSNSKLFGLVITEADLVVWIFGAELSCGKF